MKLSDRDIAIDLLCSAKHGIEDLTRAGLESSNPRLRQTLRQMRDQAEDAQEKLGQVAMKNRWYLPSSPADQNVTHKVASFFAGDVGQGETQPGATGYREPPRAPLG